jgi:large conductance mechanosensitive channel
MAVGVIVGGAFTAIVNGVSNYVLKPLTNWLLSLIVGKGSLENIVTFLGEPAYKLDADGVSKVIDMANSFYIDWGSLINAIINFFLVAFVLFSIVKFMNKVKEGNEKVKEEVKKGRLTKEQRKELKQAGIKLADKQAVKEYLAKKKAEQDAKAEEEARIAKEQAEADRLANPTVEDLLKDIKALLQGKQ